MTEDERQAMLRAMREEMAELAVLIAMLADITDRRLALRQLIRGAIPESTGPAALVLAAWEKWDAAPLHVLAESPPAGSAD